MPNTREKLIELLESVPQPELLYGQPLIGVCKVADHLIANDVVPVVRCKDCKHYHQYHIGKTNDLCEWGKCKLISMDVDMPENGFCSYGERREGE